MTIQTLLQSIPYPAFTIPAGIVSAVVGIINLAANRRLIVITSHRYNILSKSHLSKYLELVVRYRGNDLEQLWHHEIEIKNLGKKDLSFSDFPIDPKIEFESDLLSLTHEGIIQESQSSENQIVPNDSKRHYSFAVPLLKPKESIRFTCLTQTDSLPKITFRPKDFKVKENSSNNKSSSNILKSLFQFSFAGLIMLFFVSSIYTFYNLVTYKPASFSRAIPIYTPTKEEIDAQTKSELRHVCSVFTSYCFRNGQKYMPFNSMKPPGWMSSQELLDDLNFSRDVKKSLLILKERGIIVKLNPNLIGKPIYDHKGDEVIFFIEGNKDFPYSGLTENGVLLRGNN